MAIRTISRSQLRQDCVDALDSLLEERFAALGEPGITRPRDALRFTNNLEYKVWTDDLEQSAVTKFEPAAIGSTSALVPRL